MFYWNVLLTHLLNLWFAGPIDAILELVGVHPANAAAPIDNRFTLELVVFAGLVLFFMVVRLSLSVERPGTTQHLAEMVHEFVESQSSQIMGHG